MTDMITPASLRATAKWWADRFTEHDSFDLVRDVLNREAARLEAEAARDEYVEKLADVLAVAEGGAHLDQLQGWRQTGLRDGIRAVLDRLAADGRLLPEGGMVLSSEPTYPPPSPSCCPIGSCYPSRNGGVCGADVKWDGAKWVPAVSVPLELPTEPGSRIRASVKRWGSAREWADTDPYVDTFTLGERDIWHAENDCLVVGAWNREYITVLEVLPAVSVPDSGPDGTPEKPWPTWQDAPEGVEYRGTWKPGESPTFVNRAGFVTRSRLLLAASSRTRTPSGW
ncbi:hypothetical protein GS580_02890 [Rhodococcus hoagii]|nr:hypothetical protein [Prescottella equi]